jgi:hypothetical protein
MSFLGFSVIFATEDGAVLPLPTSRFLTSHWHSQTTQNIDGRQYSGSYSDQNFDADSGTYTVPRTGLYTHTFKGRVVNDRYDLAKEHSIKGGVPEFGLVTVGGYGGNAIVNFLDTTMPALLVDQKITDDKGMVIKRNIGDVASNVLLQRTVVLTAGEKVRILADGEDWGLVTPAFWSMSFEAL